MATRKRAGTTAKKSTATRTTRAKANGARTTSRASASRASTTRAASTRTTRATSARTTRAKAPAKSTPARPMTVQEAGRKGGLIGGRKGGQTVLRQRGPQFYSEIGKKGGQRVRELIAKAKELEEELAATKRSSRRSSR